MTDAATGERGDLLEFLRLNLGAATFRPALEEARAFLALPACAPPAAPASTCQPVCGAMPWTSPRVRTVPLLPRRAAARSLSILPLAFDAFHRIPVIVPSPARVLCVCLSDTGQAEREFGEAGQNLRVSLSEDDPRVDDLLLRPESHSRADADHPLAPAHAEAADCAPADPCR